jgi:transcriptional regulator with XRE-family HTH domain
MDSVLSPQGMEQRARDAGLSMVEVCNRAKIAHSTWSRWKRGRTTPLLAVYQRLIAVIIAAELRNADNPSDEKRQQTREEVSAGTRAAVNGSFARIRESRE